VVLWLQNSVVEDHAAYILRFREAVVVVHAGGFMSLNFGYQRPYHSYTR
jgi:hypothetical protein